MFHGLVSPSLAQVGTGTPPAGGAALDQIAIASIAAGILTLGLLLLGVRHRNGSTQVLRWAGGIGERITGLPGWVSFPAGVATASLVTAVFGMYWDIALHIGVGRDEGPLANPAHYFILVGLFGIFSAGYLAMVMPEGRPGPASLRITRDWHAPLGGVLICACGAFSLVGFPLDDVWHRLFGQDVTLWGPTHLMLIGGAAMTLVGIGVLLVEGRRSQGGAVDADRRWLHPTLAWPLAGGFMLGLSTFQAEFDFGVPQFRFVLEPLMLMLAAGVGLVSMRALLGRGAALGAVAFFLAIRGLLSVLVGPVLGETTPHFPLYVVAALLVEAAFLLLPRTSMLAKGLASGVAIGTIGLAAEWGWSQLWMPLPWPVELMPEAFALGLPTAIAASLLGAWIGARLQPQPVPRQADLRLGAIAGAAVLAVVTAFTLYKPADEGVRAAVALTDVPGASATPGRAVEATVRFDSPQATQGAEWLTATAWQGGGLVVDRLREVSPGVYRTTTPIPVDGNWKALIRLHRGDSLTGIPVYLPEDRAIPAPAVPAQASFTRTFQADHTILQREQKPAAGILTAGAYLVVVLIALSLLVLLAWGLHRLALGDAAGDVQPPRRKRAASRRAGSRTPQPAA